MMEDEMQKALNAMIEMREIIDYWGSFADHHWFDLDLLEQQLNAADKAIADFRSFAIAIKEAKE